ncbi:hypothetical protein V6O07_12625, partial [Arthrospira platensis SPKY2]
MVHNINEEMMTAKEMVLQHPLTHKRNVSKVKKANKTKHFAFAEIMVILILSAIVIIPFFTGQLKSNFTGTFVIEWVLALVTGCIGFKK